MRLCVLYVFLVCRFLSFFFFKQKTAYEMRISDWSSDVCSSDLDEMPVQPGDLDRAVIAGAVIMAARDLIGDDQQQDDAAGHMQPVEAGDHEEAGDRKSVV